MGEGGRETRMGERRGWDGRVLDGPAVGVADGGAGRCEVDVRVVSKRTLHFLSIMYETYLLCILSKGLPLGIGHWSSKSPLAISCA